MSLKDFLIQSKLGIIFQFYLKILSKNTQILLLGEGAYSSVYKIRRVSDNAEYALKKVKLLNLSDKEK